MDYLIQAGQLILSLSILIVLHEFGHYIPARLFKTRVEKFYLFFDWKFSLFKRKIKDTEWGIGWIPLGGYVKISGMIDESMDTEQMAKDPEPWEFRSKPAWQRLIIMIGGIVVNLIVGFIIYAMVLFAWGEEIVKFDDMPHGFAVGEELESLGFQDGDRILTVDGEILEDQTDINMQILLRGVEKVNVQHQNGVEEEISIPEEFEYTMFKTDDFFTPRFYAVLDSVVEGRAAIEAGFENGDSVVAVNGNSIVYWDEFAKEVKSHKEEEITVDVYRSGELLSMNVKTDTNGTIGVAPISEYRLSAIRDIQTVNYSFGASIPAGISKAYWTLHDYGAQLKFLFTSKGASSMGGFGAFGKMFQKEWHWPSFWANTALISLILAFMNFLPIPALDGGHIMFLLYEMVTGRPPHQKVLEYAQVAGFIFILALVIYANGNDIYKAIFE
ncbi:MAG: RIP metalloprotease RseP [Crocinitomicaceae bacterium]